MPYVKNIIAAGDNDNAITNINNLSKHITETIDTLDPPDIPYHPTNHTYLPPSKLNVTSLG